DQAASDTGAPLVPQASASSAVAGNGAAGDGESAAEAAPDAAESEGRPMRPASPEGPAEPLLSLADGVALVRAVLAESTIPPRWPMYLRQMKQFIRTARARL